jgi:hypothetical protein
MTEKVAGRISKKGKEQEALGTLEEVPGAGVSAPCLR